MDDFYDCEVSPNAPWAFTVKKLGSEELSPTDYAEIIQHYHKYGFVDCHYYEKDSKGKMHVHGIILLRKGFMRKKLCAIGFHTKLVEMYDRRGWELYILKDQYLFDPKFEPTSEN